MEENMVVIVFLGFAAILFLWAGYLIWKKEKINLIHAYHYKKVKEEDKKAYTNLMGKAMIVMGIGMLLSDILFVIIRADSCMIVLAVSVVVGLAIIIYAQIKYNHGIF